ncbi:MmgE/PrpD family protein [Lampropedia puyangensis]|uniref:MmgE/PrpD family protein n=1 Tax=Lampropedia puyangensis TaxID=1330072 RepID=A0A4V4GQV5_9BURK|nr:MmgE/PrpD family protein [Lampropedia puyangensis]THT98085.1 MmgE/PrpD family protein [Lampropedia puyangensis]
MRIVEPRIPLSSDRSTTQIAQWLQQLELAEIPHHVRQYARTSLLDVLAVAWAAGHSEGVPALQRVIQSSPIPTDGVHAHAPQPGHASLWGTALQAPAAEAAFHNSARAAALDFDTVHETGGVHADIVIAPVVLAIGQSVGASGAEVLTAHIAATEVLLRLGRATQTSSGWFRTSIYGVFGAAAAAARLLQLTPEQTSNALGIALSLAAGTQQASEEKTLTKRLQAAFAAQAGISAARLAQQGFTGPAHPFDGHFGLFALYDQADPSRAFHDLGETYLLPDTRFKLYPTCACSHAAIQAAIALYQQHALPLTHIHSGEIVITPYMNRMTGAPFVPQGNTEVLAQFNVRYAVATALRFGVFSVHHLQPKAVLDPDTTALAQRLVITVLPDALTRFAPATVHIRDAAGNTYSAHTTAQPGTIDNPIAPAWLDAKADSAFGYGPDALSPAATQALRQRIATLETSASIRALFSNLATLHPTP